MGQRNPEYGLKAIDGWGHWYQTSQQWSYHKKHMIAIHQRMAGWKHKYFCLKLLCKVLRDVIPVPIPSQTDWSIHPYLADCIGSQTNEDKIWLIPSLDFSGWLVTMTNPTTSQSEQATNTKRRPGQHIQQAAERASGVTKVTSSPISDKNQQVSSMGKEIEAWINSNELLQ